MQRVPVERQIKAVTYWLIKKGGRRPSEAAMELATMGKKKLRKMYRDILVVQQFESEHPPHCLIKDCKNKVPAGSQFCKRHFPRPAI